MRTIGISCAPERSSVRQISPHRSYSRNRDTGIPGFCIYAFSLCTNYRNRYSQCNSRYCFPVNFKLPYIKYVYFQNLPPQYSVLFFRKSTTDIRNFPIFNFVPDFPIFQSCFTCHFRYWNECSIT